MFCPNCGFKLADGANFCGNCGARVSVEQKKALQDFNALQTPVEEKKEMPVAAETVTEVPVQQISEEKTDRDEFFAPPPPPQATAWGGQSYAAPKRTCPYCKTEVAGGTTYCPTCKSFVAAEPTESERRRVAQKRNTVAFVGFIISLVSIIMGALGGGIAGIILGIVGNKQIKEGKGTGKGFATAAIVLGIVAIVVSVIVLVVQLPELMQTYSEIFGEAYGGGVVV